MCFPHSHLCVFSTHNAPSSLCLQPAHWVSIIKIGEILVILISSTDTPLILTCTWGSCSCRCGCGCGSCNNCGSCGWWEGCRYGCGYSGGYGYSCGGGFLTHTFPSFRIRIPLIWAEFVKGFHFCGVGLGDMRSDENESVLPRVHKNTKKKNLHRQESIKQQKSSGAFQEQMCWHKLVTAEPDHGKSLITSIQGPLSWIYKTYLNIFANDGNIAFLKLLIWKIN